MSGNLLVVSLGPVQDFIAAARRTRDLWFGSYLLSEISKAAAAKIADLTGTHEHLIFPAPESRQDLQPDSALNVANIILAQLPDNIDPKATAAEARNAANRCWELHAKNALIIADDLISVDIWADQLSDVVEFYAAWIPSDTPGYSDARKTLMRLLAGRKACRDFIQANGKPGVPKSSLDGARETVLTAGKGARETRKKRREILAKYPGLNQRLRLSRGEELDVIGVTKRAATSTVFPSVVRVAADPWIRGIEKDGGEARSILEQIDGQCHDAIMEKGEQASYAAGSGRRCYESSSYRHDGSTLFINSIDSMLRAAQKDNDDSYALEALLTQEEQKNLQTIKVHLNYLKHDYGEPAPYLAVLAADGDQMGKTLSEIKDIEQHRSFSKRLAQFAQQAEKTVREHDGCLVYAGGDDVLAFLPVDKCLDCARQLHDEFGSIVGQINLDAVPTLSIGIAIGHCLESLEDLLAFARAAEKAAKHPERDGLAVHLYSRGGAPIKVRGRWSDNLDRSLMQWAHMHLNNTLPDKAAFDLRTLAREYAGWPITPASNIAIEKDIERLFSRKSGVGGKLDVDLCLAELNRCLRAMPDSKGENNEHRNYHPAAMRLAEEWLIARRLARAMRQANGKEKQTTEGRAA